MGGAASAGKLVARRVAKPFKRKAEREAVVVDHEQTYEKTCSIWYITTMDSLDGDFG